MSIKAEEISALIKQQLENFDDKLKVDEVGTSKLVKTLKVKALTLVSYLLVVHKLSKIL